MKNIYLDSASTAKYIDTIDNTIISSIVDSMKTLWMNPSSLYAINVKEVIDKCRNNIAKFINSETEEIIFNSGASEGNNTVIKGFIDDSRESMIITTRLEHNSILDLCEHGNLNTLIMYCNTDRYGLVDLNHLEELLKHNKMKKTMVSICMANNEIGTIQDIELISNLVHKYNAVLHCDCTQALGHIPIDVKALGIDMLSASGHKISPVLRGIGILYVKKGINIRPLIYGSQENGLRGGTTNTYGIVGFDVALKHCDISKNSIEEICKKRDYFIYLLNLKFNCKLNGHKVDRLPNNVNVTFQQNITGESLLYLLDMSGIKVSVGSACNSRSIKPSHVLKAIGLNDLDAMKTVRFTLPEDITYDDIEYVVKEIDKAIKIIELEGSVSIV